MLELLFSIFLGWPAILATVVLAGVGLFRSDYRLLVTAAVLALPYSWLLSGFPVVQSPVFLLPVFPFASGFAMYRGREMLAWIVGLPFFLGVLLLYYVASAG
jgi:hypothetical protein